jgi:hypothetical protein
VNCDPWLRLAAAVVTRAVIDFKSGDIETALDAFLWLLLDGDIYLDVLGIGEDVSGWLVRGAPEQVHALDRVM